MAVRACLEPAAHLAPPLGVLVPPPPLLLQHEPPAWREPRVALAEEAHEAVVAVVQVDPLAEGEAVGGRGASVAGLLRGAVAANPRQDHIPPVLVPVDVLRSPVPYLEPNVLGEDDCFGSSSF